MELVLDTVQQITHHLTGGSVVRRANSNAGCVITELTDIVWEFNGLLDYLRTGKNFFDDFARLNAPLLIHLEPSRHIVGGEETVTADLLELNDRSARESVTVDIDAPGVETSREITVEGHGTVRVEDAVRFETPAIVSVAQVEVTATAPQLEQLATRSVAVTPAVTPSLYRSGRAR